MMPALLNVRLTWRNTALIVAALIVLQVLLLMAQGHTLICPCGHIKLWHGITHSRENSQQLFDWYSFTHVVHGFALYFGIWLLWRDGPLAARLILAVLIEGGWEVLENSQLVIERYRAQTVWREYYGDSVVNSVSDTIMMTTGFLIAARLPAKATVALALVMETSLIYLIRDSLALNLLMLIHPFEAIRNWQAALPTA
jgi:hypothetical protein